MFKQVWVLFLSLFFLISQSVARPSYKEAKQMLAEMPESLLKVAEEAPQVYEFSSRFDGEDSVSFQGQTFRQVLVHDLKYFMNSLKRGGYPGSFQDLMRVVNSYFKFKSDSVSRSPGAINGESPHRIQLKNLNGERMRPREDSTYNALQWPGENLVDKIAGNDDNNPLRQGELKGWSHFGGLDLLSVDADRKEDLFIEPEDLVQSMFHVLAENATSGSDFLVPNGDLDPQRVDGAYTTKEGVDITQVIHKFLQGSLFFSQVSGDYLSTDLGPGKGLNGDNEFRYEGKKNYTALEHFWDEGFGCLGASRDIATYTDVQVVKKLSKDSDGDGFISVLREKNVGDISKNASRIDLITKGKSGVEELDLFDEFIGAFLKGRELIRQRPVGYLNYVQAYAAIAIGTWERILAAVIIHYLNSTIKMMDAYGTPDYLFVHHAKFWSEMKGFSLSFQFNPTSQLSSERFDEFHQLVGERPVLMEDKRAETYRDQLFKARQILQEDFGFSEAHAKVF